MLVRMQGVAGCWLWGSCDPVNTTDVFSIRICGLKKKTTNFPSQEFSSYEKSSQWQIRFKLFIPYYFNFFLEKVSTSLIPPD